MSFKETNSFEKRKLESDKIRLKYNDRVPIIVQKDPNCKSIKEIERKKYLVPCDYSVSQFMSIIRNRLELSSDQGMFLHVNGKIPVSGDLLSNVFKHNVDEDGFLYIYYNAESVFG